MVVVDDVVVVVRRGTAVVVVGLTVVVVVVVVEVVVGATVVVVVSATVVDDTAMVVDTSVVVPRAASTCSRSTTSVCAETKTASTLYSGFLTSRSSAGGNGCLATTSVIAGGKTTLEEFRLSDSSVVRVVESPVRDTSVTWTWPLRLWVLITISASGRATGATSTAWGTSGVATTDASRPDSVVRLAVICSTPTCTSDFAPVTSTATSAAATVVVAAVDSVAMEFVPTTTVASPIGLTTWVIESGCTTNADAASFNVRVNCWPRMITT